MRLSEIRELIGLGELRLPNAKNRLNRCHTVDNIGTLARKKLPRAITDYIDGGAESEITLKENIAAFRRVKFIPKVLRDVDSINLETTLLQSRISAPIGLSPTGYTRMIDPAGEPAVAVAAERKHLPYVLSTMASTSLEGVRQAATTARLWFQLYVWRDRAMVEELINRAIVAGYDVLEVAVDTPVSGDRWRDKRNGLTIPPALTPRTILDIAGHPRYAMRMLTSPALEFANLDSAGAGSRFTMDSIGEQFDASLKWKTVQQIRDRWPGKLIIKGPLGPEDASRAVALGADGIHLSNHGGRQLDRCSSTLSMLPIVRQAIGPEPALIIDSGIRHGADIATSIALGADAAFIGRPYLWGLVAGGTAGVDRVLTVLSEQLTRCMKLLGVSSIEQLKSEGSELLLSPVDDHQCRHH